MNELLVSPKCEIVSEHLESFHYGKESVIGHMLQGGDGYPYTSPGFDNPWEAGCNVERRDLEILRDWEIDLTRCLADRKKGTVQ